TGHTRLEEFVDGHAAIDCQARGLGELEPWLYAHADHDEIGREARTIVENDRVAFNTLAGMLQVECDAFALVQRPDVVPEVVAEHATEWNFLRCDDIDRDLAGAQRGRDFQSNETRADDHRAFGAFRGLDDRATVGEGSK